MRVVLDTNVVLDLVLFHDQGVEPLRAAIEAGRIVAVTSLACLDELRRVLAYPQFGLDVAKQQSAFAWMEAHAECVGQPPVQNLLPRCGDPDDQKFLDLAWAARAAHLVTKDRALLRLARRVAKLGRFLVSLPTDLPTPPA